MFHAVEIKSTIHISVSPYLETFTMGSAVVKVSFISGAVVVVVDTKALLLPIVKFTFIDIAILVHIPSLTPSVPVLPPAFVDFSVGPDHPASALDDLLPISFEPLTIVHTIVFDDLSWSLFQSGIFFESFIEFLVSSLALVVLELAHYV